MNPNVAEVQELRKIYEMGGETVEALRGITTSIERGDFVAVMGTSGSGKSTFMNVLGCLDIPTSGRYFLEGEDVGALSSDQLAELRNRRLGFVFQGFNLLSRTTALENVMLPMVYSQVPSDVRNARAMEALAMVNLADRAGHFSNQLSGGQQQRVAIARALVNNPSVIFADEPTGNLDTKTTLEIMAIFQRLNREGITIVMVTHEPEVAAFTSRNITFRDGLIIQDFRNPEPHDAVAMAAQQ